jgi:2-desacetyl-2-hydroxyethyl bacteriochlorophyllide A dehydrogenase
MKAARLHRVPGTLSLDRVPVPKISASDVLIDVRASGICHSDVNYLDGVATVAKLPIILGHEIAGVVAERGTRVKSPKIGDRVVVDYVSSCGRCRYCRTNRENLCVEYEMIGKDVDGGFAEYLRAPAECTLKLPDRIPFDQGAIMGCAVSTAYHALKRAKLQPKETVVVIGVGGVGMHAVQLAKKIFHAGPVVAVDRFDWKLNHAERYGATDSVNTENQAATTVMRRLTNGAFADVVADFVGNEKTIQEGIDLVGKGGRLVIVGIGTKSVTISPYKSLIGKEMEIVGVDDHLKSELKQLISFVNSRKIDLSHSVTHKITLEDINTGFKILKDPNEHPIRIVASKTG